MTGFKPQELANTVWAFALAMTSDATVFVVLVSAIQQAVSDCTTQNLANTAWAFAAAD